MRPAWPAVVGLSICTAASATNKTVLPAWTAVLRSWAATDVVWDAEAAAGRAQSTDLQAAIVSQLGHETWRAMQPLLDPVCKSLHIGAGHSLS